MSMLLDLDKDYLKDMEITLMGDIINILKHARVVANKNTSEMVLSDKVSYIPVPVCSFINIFKYARVVAKKNTLEMVPSDKVSCLQCSQIRAICFGLGSSIWREKNLIHIQP
jgi:hypothetical protein